MTQPFVEHAAGPIRSARVRTSLGVFTLVGDDVALTAVHYPDDVAPADGSWGEPVEAQGHPLLREAAAQLLAYAAGERTVFDLPLRPGGTEFQRTAWSALLDIPYGQTRTYRQQAEAIGRPTAVRAVGAANGRNPIPLVIPCHRVLGSGGAPTGYAGGVALKIRLLDLESGRDRLTVGR